MPAITLVSEILSDLFSRTTVRDRLIRLAVKFLFVALPLLSCLFFLTGS